jgi:hypothetical protein
MGRQVASSHLAEKRFRIGFSFAGEKRRFVEEVAQVLGACFGREKILYDKYHESEFARSDLGFYLSRLYREECDLIVVVVCLDYDQKLWTGWEWSAIHGSLLTTDPKRVLLCRFEKALPQGVYENAGFIELDDSSPRELASRILERLAINETKVKDHYCSDFSEILKEQKISTEHPSRALMVPSLLTPRQQNTGVPSQEQSRGKERRRLVRGSLMVFVFFLLLFYLNLFATKQRDDGSDPRPTNAEGARKISDSTNSTAASLGTPSHAAARDSSQSTEPINTPELAVAQLQQHDSQKAATLLALNKTCELLADAVHLQKQPSGTGVVARVVAPARLDSSMRNEARKIDPEATWAELSISTYYEKNLQQRARLSSHLLIGRRAEGPRLLALIEDTSKTNLFSVAALTDDEFLRFAERKIHEELARLSPKLAEKIMELGN